MTLQVLKYIQNNYFNYQVRLLDFCLLQYLSSCDSKTMTLFIVPSLLISLFKTFTKRNYTSPLFHYAKCNISWFGSAIKILLSDIREYFQLHFVTVTHCSHQNIESICSYWCKRDFYNLQTFSDKGELNHF